MQPAKQQLLFMLTQDYIRARLDAGLQRRRNMKDNLINLIQLEHPPLSNMIQWGDWKCKT